MAISFRRPAAIAESMNPVPDIERSRVQAALSGRLVSCWDRLEDAVSELVALHEIPEAEIVARVRLTIAEEHEPDELARSGS
jgi:hypothetical protein